MGTKTIFKQGDKYNRLTIVSFSHKDKHNRKHFICICDCGNVKTIQGSLLTSGNTKSCGCYGSESRKLKRLPNNTGVINHLILMYKRGANSRGYNWELSDEDVRELIDKPCYYCGTEKSNKKITKNCKEGFLYNGIDRKDNNVGYTKENCVPCCGFCNRAKRVMSDTDYINLAKKIAEKWR